MDRKAWIVIALCIIGIIASQWWSQKSYQEQLAAHKAQQAKTAAEQPKPATTPDNEITKEDNASPGSDMQLSQREAATELVAPAAPQSTEPGEAFTEKTETIAFEFNTLGGGISKLSLLGYEAEHENFVQINTSDKAPIGSIGFKPEELGHDRYTLVSRNDKEVVFEGSPRAGFTVRKRYILPTKGVDTEEGHVTKLEITFENTGDQPLQSPGYFIYAGSITPVHKRDLSIYTGIGYFAKEKKRFHAVSWFDAGRIPFIGVQTRSARPFFLEKPADLKWIAVRNQYFTSMLYPTAGTSAEEVWARRFDTPAAEQVASVTGIEGALGVASFQVGAGQSVTHSFDLYTGPQKYAWLKKLGQHQEEILDYGMFKVISLALLSSMNWLHQYLGSYALAIIVLTLIIKSLLWPLQNKATNSMRKMSALSPKMTELREKYKDDPTRMNQELMKLYKTYGVNPFGGCLPMLIQIPIFFGLYRMLGTAIELRNSKFLWVKDLSQPDTILTLGSFPVNILPMVMAVAMLWQMKITPRTGDSTQQRITMFMPLIFLVFCYNYASALALYWTAQNIFTIVQLYVTRDKPLPALTKTVDSGTDKKRKRKS